jgi:hypothetical protein
VKEEASEIPLAPNFVHALRIAGCGFFTRVLGPAADPAHAEHPHFDSGLHGATPNYRMRE